MSWLNPRDRLQRHQYHQQWHPAGNALKSLLISLPWSWALYIMTREGRKGTTSIIFLCKKLVAGNVPSCSSGNVGLPPARWWLEYFSNVYPGGGAKVTAPPLPMIAFKSLIYEAPNTSLQFSGDMKPSPFRSKSSKTMSDSAREKRRFRTRLATLKSSLLRGPDYIYVERQITDNRGRDGR